MHWLQNMSYKSWSCRGSMRLNLRARARREICDSKTLIFNRIISAQTDECINSAIFYLFRRQHRLPKSRCTMFLNSVAAVGALLSSPLLFLLLHLLLSTWVNETDDAPWRSWHFALFAFSPPPRPNLPKIACNM